MYCHNSLGLRTILWVYSCNIPENYEREHLAMYQRKTNTTLEHQIIRTNFLWGGSVNKNFKKV